MILPKDYQKYKLRRILTVNELVSADYVFGVRADNSHHIHSDAWELIFCRRGTMQVLKETEYLMLEEGMLTLIPPGTLHDSASLDSESQALYLAFTCDTSCAPLLWNVLLPAAPAMETGLQQVIDELQASFELNEGELRLSRFVPNQNTPLGAEQMICCCLEQVLIGILRELTRREGQVILASCFEHAAERYLVERISAYIRSHLTEDLSVAHIARAFHYSRSRLTILCKSGTGHSLSELITNTRIQTAKSLLSGQQLTVSQIAEAAGFASAQYFSRRFRQMVGCTPSEFAARYHTLELSRTP